MKVLVMGGDGMLGHQLLKTLRSVASLKATIRGDRPAEGLAAVLPAADVYGGVDVRDPAAVAGVIDDFSPDVVVNAVGIVKQRPSAAEAVPSIEVNALFPHRLLQKVEAYGGRVIHLSTDCVFSGKKGGYVETDVPDAGDLYGRSKLLGELTEGNALTLRTSMIGRELKRKKSLLEWFLAQEGPVSGYLKAIFSGLTTAELSRVILRLITEYPEARGLYHLAGPAINKFDLLHLIKKHLGLSVEIQPDDWVAVDRSLDGTRFSTTFDYVPPSWDAMITELAETAPAGPEE